MLTLLFRTLVVYLFLIVVMRAMGKRQIGELEVTNLVTTLLISEIAALPITNPETPVLYALLPMGLLLFLEIASSVILIRRPQWKGLVSTRPTVLIRRGILDQQALSDLRISMDELLSEVRQQGVRSLADVDCAILEKNGKLTLLEREENGVPAKSLSQIVISGGRINRAGLSQIGREEEWLRKELKARETEVGEIFCATANDEGELYIIYKEPRG